LEHLTDQLAQRIGGSASELSNFVGTQRVHLRAEAAKFGKELLLFHQLVGQVSQAVEDQAVHVVLLHGGDCVNQAEAPVQAHYRGVVDDHINDPVSLLSRPRPEGVPLRVQRSRVVL